METQSFVRINLREEEKKEVLDMIESAINLGYEQFHSMFINNTGLFERNLVRRGMIRKEYPTLAKQYDEIITKNIFLNRVKEKEIELNEEISKSKKEIELDSRLDGERNFYILNKKRYKEIGDVINIGVPYSIMIPGKGFIRKYAYGITIYKNETPNIYENCLSKIKFYSD